VIFIRLKLFINFNIAEVVGIKILQIIRTSQFKGFLVSKYFFNDN